MAETILTPTLKHLLQTMAGDDIVIFGGVRWRASELLNSLTQSGSAILTRNAVEGANGVITLLNSGALDSSVTVTLSTHSHK